MSNSVQSTNGSPGPSDEVTIYTVAAEAGVSISTVSLTLNRPERVKASTREHVLEVIDRLGFVPRATATSQARLAFARIGVIAPFSSHESYQRRLIGVLTETAADLTDVVVFDQYTAEMAAAPLLDSLPLTNRLDGLIIMGLPLGERLTERLVRRQRPAVVLVDSLSERFSRVSIDDERGGELAATALLESGHRRFAWVHPAQRSREYLSAGQVRGRGFVDTLLKAGYEQDAIIEVETGNGVEGGRDALARLAERHEFPIGVFAHEDSIAAGLVAESRATGLRVPQDIAVIGYDDGPIAEALDMTTIRQPFETSGRLASRLLQELLTDPTHPHAQIKLEVEFVQRGTC